MNRIESIELTPVFVPFHKDVLNLMQRSEGGLGMAIAADQPWTGGDFVICKLIDNEGNTGVGEIFLWLPESGPSPAQAIDVIQNGLSMYVLGESPFNTEKIRRLMDTNVTRNEMAKGLIDMACYDLMGKITGRPAHDFMGGRTVDEIPLAALIPLMETDAMNFQILKNAQKSLKQNGIFIFTCLNALFPLFHSVKDFLNSAATEVSSEKLTFDLMTFRETSEIAVTDDSGKKKKMISNERYYTPSEIRWLLTSLQFKKIEIFGCKLGAFSREDPLSTEDFEMLVVARK